MVAAMLRPATYWHMLPEYNQGRKAIWSAVNPHTGKRRIDEAFPHELRENTNEQEMFLRFKNGSTWQVMGSDRYDAAVGSPPAGVVFSEWALANPAAWGYIAPILLENDGWSVFISTPRGRNHAFSMLEMARKQRDWFVQVQSVADTGAVSLEAVEQQRVEYHGIYGVEGGDALIEQEYWCSFEAAVLGSYYGKLIAQAEAEGRIGEALVEPDLPVHVAWDLGVGDTTVLWFAQFTADGVRLVDHYANHGYVISHYLDVIEQRASALDFQIGRMIVPQDAKVRDLSDVGDVNKIARQRVVQLQARGHRIEFAPRHRVEDGINAVRVMLPQCRFDRTRCQNGIEALRSYKHDWDEQKRVFRDAPLHDWASDHADSFRYLAMAWRSMPKPTAPMAIKPVKEVGDYTIDELWKLQPDASSRRV